MFFELLLFFFTYFVAKFIFNLFKRHQQHKSFSSRGIPGPKPNIFFGNWVEYRRTKNKNDFLDKYFEKYGPMFGYYLGDLRFIVSKDLDLIQEAFLKNSANLRNRPPFALDSRYFKDSLIATKDERWRVVRKIISPTFSAAKVQSEGISGSMHDCLQTLNQQLDDVKKSQKAGSEFNVDISNKLQAFTLDIIGRTSLGLYENVYEASNELMNSVREFFLISNNIAVDLCMFFPFLRALLTFVNHYLTSGRMIDMIVKKLRLHVNRFLTSVNSNSAVNENNQDTPHSSASTSINSAIVLRSLLKRLAEKQITEEEFLGNALLIILAGYETSANSIAYTLYLLAKHPEIQEKLRADIKLHGQDSPYLEQVWMESLRIFPPVSMFVSRVFSEDVCLNGIQFLKDDVLQVPIWAIHHDPNIYPDPYKFDPERFSKENREQMHPCQFLAFGLGPRICLGANFANYEAKMLLSDLLLKFRLEKSSKTEDPLKLVMPTVILNPVNNIILKFVTIEE